MTSPVPLPRRFRWLPGMRYRLSSRHPWCRYEGEDASDDDGNLLVEPSPSARSMFAFPDLSDPATLGCLLALVREAWGMPTGIVVRYSDDEALWGVSWSGATPGGWCGRGKTEGAALLAALKEAGFHQIPRPSAFVRVSALPAGGSPFNPPPDFLASPVPGEQGGQVCGQRPLNTVERTTLFGCSKAALARGEYLRAAYYTLAAGGGLDDLTEHELRALYASDAGIRLYAVARTAVDAELQNGLRAVAGGDE